MKRAGAGVSAVGQRRARKIDQLPSLLVAKAPQLHALERRLDAREPDARPALDIGGACRPERGKVAADEQLPAGRGVGVARPDPVLRSLVEIRAAMLPGSRRRDAHEIEVGGLEPVPADEVDQLVPAARAFAQRVAQVRVDPVEAERGQLRPRPPEPLAPRLADRLRPGPVLATRDDVDRPAEERALDEHPALERPRQLLTAEVLDPRPKRDVRGRRVLRLDSADPVDDAGQRQAHALEQQLAREQRAVQLALR